MADRTDTPCKCGHAFGVHRFETGCRVVGCTCEKFDRRRHVPDNHVGKLPCGACSEWRVDIRHDGLCPQCKMKIDGIIKISQVESYNDWDAD